MTLKLEYLKPKKKVVPANSNIKRPIKNLTSGCLVIN